MPVRGGDVTQVAQVMLWIFLAACCAGVAAWFYAVWNSLALGPINFIPKGMSDVKQARRKKAVRRGVLAFFCAIALAFAAGGVAHLAGGWG